MNFWTRAAYTTQRTSNLAVGVQRQQFNFRSNLAIIFLTIVKTESDVYEETNAVVALCNAMLHSICLCLANKYH